MFVTNPGPMPTDSAKPAALIFGYRSSPPFCNLGFRILCASLRCTGCAYHVVRHLHMCSRSGPHRWSPHVLKIRPLGMEIRKLQHIILTTDSRIGIHVQNQYRPIVTVTTIVCQITDPTRPKDRGFCSRCAALPRHHSVGVVHFQGGRQQLRPYQLYTVVQQHLQ